MLQHLDEGYSELVEKRLKDQEAARQDVKMPDKVAVIPNGFYTLTFPDESRKTFRIWTKRKDAKFAPGKRIIGMLIGPDNTMDYEQVGFVNDDGVQVWKRYKGQKVERYCHLIWVLGQGQKEGLEGYELVVSKKCLICNRELTDPESVERGIGPGCWEKMKGG